SYTKLKTKSSKTVSIDYSLSTLVFDVEVTMVPIETLVNPPPETVITIRWYLRLTSTFNPAFTARGATKGVGFFMTERSAEPVIERRSLPLAGTALIAPQRVHYFLKNIPEQFKASFRASFDEWNGHFKDLLGQELLSYDFVAVNDPRSVLLVTGDPRFNIVEWDVVNAAPYGGLGPSIANQFTGEMLTSNVLIQGPRILKIYSTWFQASETAREMSARGDENGANRVMRDFARSVRADEESTAKTRFKIDIGQRLHFRVRSEDPQVSDPIMQREDFDPIPTGFTFESYMPGYFEDMLEHELGHNFGLRHNFRGSLKGAETPVLGKVSASCMDYLGRGFRYLDRVGPYDRVAISYGYLGKLPMETGAFCTDDDVADVENLENSAECSRDDATPDPYSFFEKRLDRAIGLLVNKGSPEAPIWSLDDMKREFTVAINGLGLYGATAEVTGDTWSNFFGVAGRPNSAKRVKEFVSKDLSLRLCDPALNDVVSAKSGEAAKAATLANITAMRKRALELLTPMKALEASGLGCQ
ncbi:MAG: zinc-dependent metalloprotease, partial [Deltaproteobacteria bacterium]|nr:zinc-dependent metalloprotease [Deltaproteobacteria bacterium]